jgi:hypothetical protein
LGFIGSTCTALPVAQRALRVAEVVERERVRPQRVGRELHAPLQVVPRRAPPPAKASGFRV